MLTSANKLTFPWFFFLCVCVCSLFLSLKYSLFFSLFSTTWRRRRRRGRRGRGRRSECLFGKGAATPKRDRVTQRPSWMTSSQTQRHPISCCTPLLLLLLPLPLVLSSFSSFSLLLLSLFFFFFGLWKISVLIFLCKLAVGLREIHF